MATNVGSGPLARSRVVLLIAAGLLVAALLSSPGRTAVGTALLIPYFFPGDVPRPLSALTSAPSVTTIQVPNAPGRMVADVYRPVGDARRPAIILLLGVDPLPRDHAQVTTLAEGIARVGIVTVVAESEALVAGEIRPEEIDNLVALFTHLERDPGIEPARIGFVGLCVGGVLELIAASDPRIADRVAFVNAFSVYADALDVLRAVVTETMPTAAGPIAWTPHATTRKVFTQHALGSLPVDRDRALLRRELVEGTPLTAPEGAQLSPLGQQVRQLLTTRDPAGLEAAIARLPAAYVATLRELSPVNAVGRLRAKTFVMHDQADTLLPVSGARALAALLPAQTSVRYSEFRLFEHVVPGGFDDPIRFVGELIKLFGHIHAVLTAAYHN